MGPLNEASAAVVMLANKDMTVRVKGDYKGDHAKLKELLNLAVENLDKALQQVAIGAATSGLGQCPDKHRRAGAVTGRKRAGKFFGGSVKQFAGDVLHDEAERPEREGCQGRV